MKIRHSAYDNLFGKLVEMLKRESRSKTLLRDSVERNREYYDI
jgi:hypothetical protein